MSASAARRLRADLAEGRRHGTLVAYTLGGCRCEWCRMANRAYHGANQARLHDRTLRVVSADTRDERITVELTQDELALLNEWAAKSGLSRQAYVRQCVKRVIEVEQANERNRERELRTPLLEV